MERKMKLNNLVLIACIVAFMFVGGAASATVCDTTDDNNTEGTATPIGFTQTVAGTVCPDDPFDFYVIQIPDGSTLSGQMTFSSPQESTVIRIYHSVSGARIVDDVFTNDVTKQYVFTVNPGDIPSGTYYMRLFFWSNAAYDHDYTVEMNLEDGSSLNLIEIDPDIAKKLLSKCPWPNPSGTARKANRSSFQGPFGLIKRAHSVKMGTLYTNFTEPAKYEGLVVGPESEIIFMNNSTNDLHRYKFTGSRQMPDFSSASSRPPCFDNMGRLCVIEWGQYLGAVLVYYKKFKNDELWRAGLPMGSDYAVVAAGQQIYTKVGGTAHSLQVWNKDGDKICDLPFDSPIGGVAEDLGHKKFFVQTRKALHKFDFNGNQEWAYEDLALTLSDSPEAWEASGPIVDYAGNVWATGSYTGPWAVLKPDGTVYKSGGNDPFLSPIPVESSITRVAFSSDGRFFELASGGFMDTVTCYEDWDQKVWSATIYGAKVYDMILDSQNRIYICFLDYGSSDTAKYGWKCLDPVNGNVILSVMDIAEPAELLESKHGAELAIGSDRQLVMLMGGGYLTVFETDTLKAEYIKMSSDKTMELEEL